MEYPGLQLLTQGIFALLFLLTVIAFIRRPHRARLEIAVLFGTLGGVVVLQQAVRVTGLIEDYVGLVTALLLVTHPYLLVRLLRHFRPISRLLHRLALLGLVASWTLILVSGMPLATAATVAVVAIFVSLEAYAAYAFVHAARTSHGINRDRLVAVALGTGFLAAVLVLAGLRAALPDVAAIAPGLSALMALASGVSYYVGFAPPRWLRRSWQMAELGQFLVRLSGQSAQQRLTAAVDFLGPAAARAVGAKAAVVALGDEVEAELRIYRDPDNHAPPERAGVETLRPFSSPLLSAAWQERPPVGGPRPGAPTSTAWLTRSAVLLALRSRPSLQAGAVTACWWSCSNIHRSSSRTSWHCWRPCPSRWPWPSRAVASTQSANSSWGSYANRTQRWKRPAVSRASFWPT